MRKNDLIKQLQQIKGNPEVMLWNGYVGDFMKVGEVSESDLVKQTKDYFFETCRLADCRERNDWTFQLSTEDINELNTLHRKMEYEVNQYVTQEHIKAKKYQSKRILAISPKQSGKKYFDRLGTVEY